MMLRGLRVCRADFEQDRELVPSYTCCSVAIWCPEKPQIWGFPVPKPELITSN